MKTNSLFLAILILFQSCYSTKKVPVNTHQISFSKEYKVSISKKKSFRGKIIKVTIDTLVIKSKGIDYAIPKTSIKELKELTYSRKKTTTLIGLVAATVLIVIGLNALNNINIFSDVNFNWGWI